MYLEYHYNVFAVVIEPNCRLRITIADDTVWMYFLKFEQLESLLAYHKVIEKLNNELRPVEDQEQKLLIKDFITQNPLAYRYELSILK